MPKITLSPHAAARGAMLLHILAHEQRLLILQMLAEAGEAPVPLSVLAARLPVSQSALAQHLMVLRTAEVVRCEPAGRRAFYKLISNDVRSILQALE